MMKINRIIETCIYASDLQEAEKFYSQILELEQVSKEEDRHIFYRCGNSMLLIFNPVHTSAEQTFVNGDPIPLHGTSGPGHLAFEVQNHDIPEWKARLIEWNIKIESEITWPSGFNSIYFRDPAGNSIEIVSSGLWE
jgi:catechol 2,3-dioxygenase-like lactoylglutathione lyase family enzyme